MLDTIENTLYELSLHLDLFLRKSKEELSKEDRRIPPLSTSEKDQLKQDVFNLLEQPLIGQTDSIFHILSTLEQVNFFPLFCQLFFFFFSHRKKNLLYNIGSKI